MRNARFIIRCPGEVEREVALTGSASLGRAPDNVIPLEDAAVSPYHALIEERADGFWVEVLGGAGTTILNGVRIKTASPLRDGDQLAIGAAVLIFSQSSLAAKDGARASIAQTSSPSHPGGDSRPLIFAVLAGLLVVGLAAVLLVTLTNRGGDGPGAVRIIGPEKGATLDSRTVIRLRADRPESIKRVTYQINGREVAVSEIPPDYPVELGPENLPPSEIRRDGSYSLTASVEDKQGHVLPTPDPLLLAFHFKAESGRTAAASVAFPDGPEAPPGADEEAALRLKVDDVASRLSNQRGYVFSTDFIREISRRKAAYLGLSVERGRRDEIERAFATTQGLPSMLGTFTAASLAFQVRQEAGLPPSLGGAGTKVETVWMPQEIAAERGCYQAGVSAGRQTTTLSQSADCASSYMKAVWGQFEEGDFMYAIACYGMKLDSVGRLSNRLRDYDPAARRDFMAMVKLGVVPPDAADRVFRFFSAAVFGKYF